LSGENSLIDGSPPALIGAAGVPTSRPGAELRDGSNQLEHDLGPPTQITKINLGIAPRVLLVDDDELVLAQLKVLVEAAGFEVFTALNGSAALGSLEQDFAPIVIMDLAMAGLDGLAICRTIRQRTWPGYVYILLLTVHDSEEHILAGLDAGADDYLSKRISSAQLLARLRTAQRILTLEHSLKNALAEKRRLAFTDSLTGAPNRRYFQRRLSRALERLHGVGGALCLLSLDIDHFKEINDRYGHASGDAVLQELVARIGQCLPGKSDWFARMGGEEFAVVLEEADLTGATLIAERLREAIAGTPIRTRAGEFRVTVSIGLSELDNAPNREAASVESLLHLADRRLYISKGKGRNCVTAF
jgi:two-component system, cell cycle response regulator